MKIETLTSEELIREIMKYIRENYGYEYSDIFEDEIHLIDDEGTKVNIYLNVESEDE